MIQKLVVPSLQTEHRMALAKLASAAFGCKRKVKCSAPPVQLPVAMERWSQEAQANAMEDHWIIVENVHMSNIVKAHANYEVFSAQCQFTVPSRMMIDRWWFSMTRAQ